MTDDIHDPVFNMKAGLTYLQDSILSYSETIPVTIDWMAQRYETPRYREMFSGDQVEPERVKMPLRDPIGDVQRDVPFDQLDSVMTILSKWGGVYFDGDYREDLSAQFVLDDSGAYFEICLAN